MKTWWAITVTTTTYSDKDKLVAFYRTERLNEGVAAEDYWAALKMASKLVLLADNQRLNVERG